MHHFMYADHIGCGERLRDDWYRCLGYLQDIGAKMSVTVNVFSTWRNRITSGAPSGVVLRCIGLCLLGDYGAFFLLRS